MIPPTLAILALPLIVWGLFQRYDVRVALCISIIGSYLMFPGNRGFDFPMLPPFNKYTIPGLVALVILAIRYSGADLARAADLRRLDMRDVLPGGLPRTPIGRITLFAIFTAPILTVLTNGDAARSGGAVLRALQPYDAIAALFTTGTTILPLLLARKFLATERGHATLLMTLAIAGFVYSFLAAYEIRMSPQLNLYVYGFRGSNWIQNLRGDGFRPFVFLQHGLWLGIFISGTVVAIFACMRHAQSPAKKLGFLSMGVWAFIVLALTKAFGAFLIALLLVPVAIFLSVRLQVIVAATLAGIVLLYPMTRSSGLIPVNWIVSQVAAIEPERASSLQFRLNNEDILLDKASQRPFFGWGGWDRARVYNENGRDISTTDGRWIIVIGEEGWYGYLGKFGVLALPILALAFRRRYEIGAATSGLCLVLAGNMVDLIPNGTLTMVTWLVAGALLGRLEAEKATADEPAEPTDVRSALASGRSAGAGPKYTRFQKRHTRNQPSGT